MSTNDLTLQDHVALIERAVLEWPGVNQEPGRFGSTAFMLGRREIGHIHGNSVADFGLPRALRDELIATGQAQPHQAGIPGGVSHPIRNGEDVARVLALFRLNYDRLQAAAARSVTVDPAGIDQAEAD